jgi:crotonobetainyl-CoA:carnitine CoA-transferase CaiB-like acyl-CoA transferase
MMLESDRYWADFCRHVERPELIDDPRFKDAAARYENRRACVGVLDEVFASRPFAEWRSRLSTLEGVWAPMQTVREVHDDPQSVANGYLPVVASAEGIEFTLVANPVQFDETSPALSHAPDHGQHTEEVLLELGLTWPEIAAHKESGAIL